jgi:hypothetical protein
MGDAESMGCEAFVTQLVRRSHDKLRLSMHGTFL